MHCIPAKKMKLLGVTVTAAALVLVSMTSPSASSAARRKVTKARVVAPSLQIRVLGDEQTVPAGQTATYLFAVSTAGKLSTPPSFDVPEVPPGVTASITAKSATSYELQMTTSASAVGG